MKHELKDQKGEVYYSVEYLPEHHILFSEWFGSYLLVEEVKEGALLGLEKMKEYQVTKLLNDNTNLEGTWDEANDWIAQEWMPKAIEAGLMKFAHILAPDIFGQLAAEFMGDNAKKLEEETKNVFQMRMFGDLESAKKWLLE